MTTELRVTDFNNQYLVLAMKSGKVLRVTTSSISPKQQKTINLALSLNLKDWSETGPAPLFVQANIHKDTIGNDVIDLLSFEIRND